MTWLMGVYRAQSRMTLARYLQYRVELHIWLAQLILRPIVFMVVWASAAKAMGGTLRGFTPRDFAAYFIIAMLVHHATLAWLMFEWEPMIKTGDLSSALLKPVHLIHRYISENITFKAATMPFMLAAGLALAVMFNPKFDFAGWSIAMAVPALLLAAALFFAIAWTLGMLSFFTTEVDAINNGFFLLMLLFSGQMGPLLMMPHKVQIIALALPFWWIIGFPTELLLGHLTPAQAAGGLLIQIGWVSLWIFGMARLWKRGLRSYTAVGL
jgi:ABC-2 type transport system permease protein